MFVRHRDKDESGRDYSAWREYARDNTITLKNVIKRFSEDKQNTPQEVLYAIRTILRIFSGLETLKEHKKKFKRLVVDASALIVIVWQAYKELPASKFLSQYVERLDQTMISANKLLTKKIKRKFVKRKILCILADYAKLTKYKKRLDSAAVELEHNLHNLDVDITQTLREVMAEDGHVKQGGKQRAEACNGGAISEDSCSSEVQKSTTVKQGEKEGNELFGERKKQNSEDEQIIRPEEVKLDTIVEENPKPQRTDQSPTAKCLDKRSPSPAPSHTDSVETDEFFGAEMGKINTYTAEPEAEEDSVQGTSRRGELGSRAERSQTARSRPEPRSSISGFSFTTNGGTISNNNVGVIYGG